MQPRVRAFAEPLAYLLSLALLFGAASLYLAGGTRVPRARGPAAPSPSVSAQPGEPRLVLDRDTFPAGTPATLGVRLTDLGGAPLDPDTGRGGAVSFRLVRHDLDQVLPLRAMPTGDGRWVAPLTLPTAGPYRLLAQFRKHATAEPLLLTADLRAPGSYRPADVPAPATRSNAWPYGVTMTGNARAGKSSRLSFTLLEEGAPTEELAPAPHAVLVLRVGDLRPATAMLRTPPEAETEPSQTLEIEVDCPHAGVYRLFLIFQDPDAAPHTAEFTLPVAA